MAKIMETTTVSRSVQTHDHLAQPYPRLAKYLGYAVDACLYALVAITPLLFLPFTVDALELSKQTFLIFFVLLAAVAWAGRAIALRQFVLWRSWLHLVVLMFVIGYGITSFFSLDKYLSFAGNFGQMQWAFSSIVAFILLYFIVVNHVRGTTKIYNYALAFLASSIIAAAFGLLQMLGVFPFGALWDFTQAKTFNTVGTINSFGVYMTLPLVLSASLTVLKCKDQLCVLGKSGIKHSWAKALVWISLFVSLLVAIIVDFWVIWAAILFGTGLLVLLSVLRTRQIDHPVKIVVPTVLVILSVFLLLFRTPLNLSLPAEVSPSARASWEIARQTLQSYPLFGTGPGTWIFDYSKYRPAGVNQTQFWTARFERGLSTFLSLPAMIGLVGIGLWLILLISGVVKSASHLVSEKNDDAWQAYLTVFTVWATTAFVGFLYNYNFTHHFAFWFFLALLVSLVARGTVHWDTRASVGKSAALSLVFIFVVVGAISGMWVSVQRLASDFRYWQSVTFYREGKPVQSSIDALQSAVALNKWSDVYLRNLSQAYLIRSSQELQAAPDAERAKKVNASVSLAVETARRATELSPANVDNWGNFAAVLQAISPFTRGADEQAIKMYREAEQREPNNPVFANEIGKLHVLRSDAHRQLLQSNDQKMRKEAEANIKTELEKAAEALNQSLQIKGDYAPAHYNLGLVYERQGRIKDAIVKLEQVLQVENQNVGIAFQLSILYYRNNEKDKSQNVLEQIVNFDPSYANARWYLSWIYEERNRLDDAIVQMKKLKELMPDNPNVDQRLAYLEGLKKTNTKSSKLQLPEPMREEIQGPSDQNRVKRKY